MGGSELALLACARAEGAATITLSSGEILEVAESGLPTDLPAPGGLIGADLLARLREGAARKTIARRVFALLDRRLWSVGRLRRKLLDEGHPDGAVDQIIEQFTAQGLLSDLRYAEAYCRDAIRQRPVGRRYLKARLREQGVGETDAVEALARNLPPAVEAELALAAARRRWRTGGSPARASDLARVVRFLEARGFPSGLAQRSARAAGRDGAPPGGGGEGEPSEDVE